MGEKSTSEFVAVYLYSMVTFFTNRHFCLYIWDTRQYQHVETIGIIPRSEPIIMSQIKKVIPAITELWVWIDGHMDTQLHGLMDTHIRPTARFPTGDQYQWWIKGDADHGSTVPRPLSILIVSTKVYRVSKHTRWSGGWGWGRRMRGWEDETFDLISKIWIFDSGRLKTYWVTVMIFDMGPSYELQENTPDFMVTHGILAISP